jgi:hypothetical protein
LPPSQNGPSQLPQNDGVSNLQEFAFNPNPLAPDVATLTFGAGDSVGLPTGASVGGGLKLEFLRRKASTNPGITYTALFGSDLDGWLDVPTGTPAGVSIVGAWERVTVDDPIGGATRFGRVKVETAP